MKTANRSVHLGLLAVPGRPKSALILLAAALLLLLLAAASGVAHSATPDGGDTDTKPYFVNPDPLPTQIYRVGQPIPTVQLPRAAGGNGALNYIARSFRRTHCGEGSPDTGPAVQHQGSGSALTKPKSLEDLSRAEWSSYVLRDWMRYTPPLASDNHGGTIGPHQSQPSPSYTNWRAPTFEEPASCISLMVTDTDSNPSLEDAAYFSLNYIVKGDEPETVDYDTDDDGLIEISNLGQLRAVSRDMNGDGRKEPLFRGLSVTTDWPPPYEEFFTNAVSGMGCPDTGCIGYELMADLDFDSNGDGRVTIADHNGEFWWPTLGSSWLPLGEAARHRANGDYYETYSAIFEGNGHTIANLHINLTVAETPGLIDHSGLFGKVSGTIRNLGLVNAKVTTNANSGAGILVSKLVSSGVIQNSYATGQITLDYAAGSSSRFAPLGGLVGTIDGGAVISSYSTATVTGRKDVVSGGLAGLIKGKGTVTASYATGAVTGANRYSTGGLAGQIEGGKITASYATGQVTGSSGVSGGLAGKAFKAAIADSYYRYGAAGKQEAGVGVGKSAKELKEPTKYTGIYAKWNLDLDGDGTPDNPWNFGTSADYPVLKKKDAGKADKPSGGKDAGKADKPSGGKDAGNGGQAPDGGEAGNGDQAPVPPPTKTPEQLAEEAHPEVYHEAEYGIKVACSEVQKFHAKLTFDLGGYTGKLALSLSLWGSSSYLSYEAHGLQTPALHLNGQTASVEISTHPPQTRFRLDTPDGRNLLLGYADCRTDAPALDEDGNPPPPPPKTPEERAAEDNKEVYETDSGNGNGDAGPMSVSCEVGGDSAVLTFNLGSHSGPVQLTLMQWDGVVFRSYAALGLTAPALQRNGQTATVEIPTHTPERVRFRLDSQYGRNLLLGYADCHEDTPGPVTEVTEETPEETVTPVTPGAPPAVQSAAATLPPAATVANREVYADAGRAMSVSCTEVTSKGATLNFDLGSYTRSLTMVLSLWDGTVFRSYASQNIAQPALEREGQKATVSIATNPALTRFRLDSDIGTNLLLGYADCRTDAP